MDIAKELPTVISFCSGYGGIERGLDLAGVEHRVIAYVEIEAFCVANLVAKMESGQLPPAPIFTNLKTFPAEVFRDRCDLITGGYPCQPFSAAGMRKGEDDPRHLWPFIRRHIAAIRPHRVFFENVEGHISLGLSSVIADLEEDCYRSAWGIFSAREVGAPHQRKRVFIMADTDNGQRELKDQEIRARRDSAVDGCADLADTDNPRQQSGCGSIQESEVRNHFRGGGKELADSASQFGQRGIAEGVGSGKSQKAIGNGGAFESVADPDSAGCQQGHQEDAGQSPEQSYCGGVQPRGVSDTDNKGLERRLQRGQLDQIGRQEQTIRCATECSDRGSWDGHRAWALEPGLGRVVDGCADRVDRIRLLGNGVVPATAAKAWGVLNARM